MLFSHPTKKGKWYKLDPSKLSNLFISSDIKYGNYDYSNDLRTHFRKKFDSLLSSLVPGKGKKVLIGGSNRGVEINALKNHKITALDASKIALKKLSSKHKNVKIVLGDLNKLPFKDNSFDVFVCMRAITSSKVNLKKALLESLRVIKKNGLIILSIPNGYMINGKIQKGMYDYKKKAFDLKKPYDLTKKIVSFYEENGFKTDIIDFPSEIIIKAKK